MNSVMDNQQQRELLSRIAGELGLSVFPCEANGKKPAFFGWQEFASSDTAKVESWYDAERFNYGVLCGTTHDGRYLTVVDIDCKKGKIGKESWASLTEKVAPELLDTFSVQTPSGGTHYYFYSKHQFGNRTDVLDGIDLRGKGGYVVGAGSSIGGALYLVANDAPIADMPEELELALHGRRERDNGHPSAAENERPQIDVHEADKGKLLELLSAYSDQRGFASYSEWIKLGGALKHEGFSVEDWQRLSWANAREECSKKWSSLPTSQLTMGSLVYWARKVDPNFLASNSPSRISVERVAYPTKGISYDMTERVFNSREECMRFFDERYFKVILGNKAVVVERNGDISISLKKGDFYDAYVNKKVNLSTADGEPFLASAAKYWFENTNENYRRLIFNPNPAYEPKDDEINLWMGFTYKAESNGKSGRYLAFVKEVICNGNEDLYEFLMDVMAQIVQEPHRKLGVGIAVALRGRQGVGKNFFVENFGELFGEAFIAVDNVESISGRFNTFLMNKIVVFGDEAIWGGDRVNRDKIKSIITTEKLNIEKKFKDAFVADNYCRFFFATNSDWAAPVEKGNRRYLVLDVSDAHVRDIEYFGAIKADLESGGYEDLLYVLMNQDFSGRDFQNSLPTTAASIENLINGFSGVESWLFNALITGRTSVMYGQNELVMSLFDEPCATDSVYDSYCVQAKNGFKERKEVFSMKMKRILPSLLNRKRSEDGDRPHVYVFPSLEQARREFENHFGVEIDWDNI